MVDLHPSLPIFLHVRVFLPGTTPNGSSKRTPIGHSWDDSTKNDIPGKEGIDVPLSREHIAVGCEVGVADGVGVPKPTRRHAHSEQQA